MGVSYLGGCKMSYISGIQKQPKSQQKTLKHKLIFEKTVLESPQHEL